jgi:Fe-S cluster assembly protein SufD
VLPDADLASLATAAHTLTIELQGNPPPLIVRRLSDGKGRHADRLRVRLAPGTCATLIETHEAQGAPFANSLTEIAVGEGANLTRLIAQPAADDAVIVHTTLASLAEKASLGQTAIALGGALVRHETRLVQDGESHAQLDGLYRLTGKRHCDTTTHVDYVGEGAETSQLVKGVASGRARGVFQGKFHVARGAQHTDAKMAHHALLLEQGAQINAKPELEIYADDVECAHGNTAGALDPEAMFYLRQRGLSEEQARSLLIDAFAGEVLARVQDETVREQLERVFREGLE